MEQNEPKTLFLQRAKISVGVKSLILENNRVIDKVLEYVDWENCQEDKKTIIMISNDKDESKVEKTFNYTCKSLLVSFESNIICVLGTNNILLVPLIFNIKKSQKPKNVKVKSSEYNGIEIINNNIVLYLNSDVVGIYSIPK